MTTVFNIENFNVHTLVLGEAGHDLSEEFLKGNGQAEMPAYADSQVDLTAAPQEAAELERRLNLAERLEPIPDYVQPIVRKAHLLKAMKTAARLRMYRGAVTTHQPTGVKYPEAVEVALSRADLNFAASLAQACGHCAFKGQCRLEGRPEAWLRAHPTSSKSRTNKGQQTFQEFEDSLDQDPQDHCVPTRNRQHKLALATGDL